MCRQKKNLKIAVIQMSSSVNKRENIEQADGLLSLAAGEGAELAVLPENVLCHGLHEQIRKIADYESGWTDKLKKYSVKHALTVIWGGLPVKSEGQLYNMTLAIDKSGVLTAKYAKNHLFRMNGIPSEADIYSPGADSAEFTFNGWRIGLSICFDIRFPEFFRSHGRPDLILCAAAFTEKTGKAHWEVLCRARAVENQCYLAAAGQHTTGEIPFRTYGHSMIIDPWGKIIGCIDSGAGIISAELTVRNIAETRKKLPMDRSVN